MDVICMGRVGMDLYSVEEETPFSQVGQLRKSFGGSPGNIAVGTSRLGVKVGFIGKLSDDMIGRAVREFLISEGVDTSQIAIDSSGGRTSLAITETKADDCSVVIYRNSASDLLLEENEISEDYISRSRLLMVSGTALSASPSREAVMKAVQIARDKKVKVFTDLDYRPYSWPDRKTTAQVYQAIAAQTDYLVGNTEEFECFDSVEKDPHALARKLIRQGLTAVTIKEGKDGSTTHTKEGEIFARPFPVKAKKPFGAGDAFASAYIYGILSGLPVEEYAQLGSAAAAIVVTRFGCAESMPNLHEIKEFIAGY